MYGVRLIKARKKFINYQVKKQKQKKIVNNIDYETSEISENFMENLYLNPNLKTRATDNQSRIKKKYFRQPKIY